MRERIAGPMAEAFGSTFWWALGLGAVAFVVAVTLLPRDKAQPVDDATAMRNPGRPWP